jgi:Mg2+ and Co2+ transporter CorA
MVEESLSRIEKTIQNAQGIDSQKRSELLALTGELRGEVAKLADTDQQHAQSIAGFAQVTTHEATRDDRNPDLLRLSLDGLTASVERFEATHPRLVRAVNNISQMLSNIGLG